MAKFITLGEDGKSLVDASYDVRQVTIPYGVERIEGQAFANCTKLERVDIPESVTEIGEAAFYNCKKLKSITFAGNLLKIGDNAFDACTSLKHIGGIEYLKWCDFGRNVFGGIGGTRLSTPSGNPIVYMYTDNLHMTGFDFTVGKSNTEIYHAPLECFSSEHNKNTVFYKVELIRETEDSYRAYLIKKCNHIDLLNDFNKLEYAPERVEKIVRSALQALNPSQITTLLVRIGYFDKNAYIIERTDTDILKQQIDKAIQDGLDIDTAICGNDTMCSIKRVGNTLKIKGINNFKQLLDFVKVEYLVDYLSNEGLLEDFQKISLDFLAE